MSGSSSFKYVCFSLCLYLALNGNNVAIQGAPNGAPRLACGDMTPQHGVDPQTSVSPYATTPSSVRLFSYFFLPFTFFKLFGKWIFKWIFSYLLVYDCMYRRLSLKVLKWHWRWLRSTQLTHLKVFIETKKMINQLQMKICIDLNLTKNRISSHTE